MAINLEVHRGDHSLLDYCTFGLEVVDDAHTECPIAYGKDQNLSKNDNVISQCT